METIIHSMIINGVKVVFVEDDDGYVDFFMDQQLDEESHQKIIGYLLDEGIFEGVFGQEYIDQLREEWEKDKEDEENA